MRGRACDALIGTVYRPSPSSVPDDTLINNNNLRRPSVYMNTSTTDRHYELAKRRREIVQLVNYPQMPAYLPDASTPNVLRNNGIAALPNAGIYYQEKITIAGVKIS
jgi:hypothetical protein